MSEDWKGFCWEKVGFPKYIYNSMIKFVFTALDEAIKTFEEAVTVATSKTYDYLDSRNSEFNQDFNVFMKSTDELRNNLGNIIEQNYADVWETPQGVRFLTKFEKV